MEIDHLFRDVRLPPMARVRRRFDVDTVADIAGTVRSELETSGLAGRLKTGDEVAIGVGSRGISHLPEIVARVVDWFIALGARPFVFPAMGSHGGATSDGQVKLLECLGVTPDRIGCPIRSEIEASKVGRYQTRVGTTLDVHFDRHAITADAIIVLSRIKPHPGFIAKHESGFCKMLSIGCGKHVAAETCHRLGYAHFPEIIVGAAEVIIDKLPKLLGGLAIVENALHGTALIECVPRERLIERDAALLDYARTCLPSLPSKMLHALVIDYMGKNIAGPGMDPNITGRYLTDRTGDIDVSGLAVLNLTPQAHGNANGMGAADYLTRRLYDQIDFTDTYLNGLTDPATVKDVSVPPVMPHDRGAMSMALKKGNTFDEPPLMARIRDTLTLDRLLVSPALMERLKADPEYTIIDEPRPIEFDANGNLADRYAIWDTF
ncbi:MAG: DUF362 domain-containing protein [Pseudomonadota bacterium]